MDHFCGRLKRKYLERRITHERQWPPCYSDKLIRLELLEREKEVGYFARASGDRQDTIKRTPIAYADLFEVDHGSKRPVKRVLVEGVAGVGKTTLCIAVSEGWAEGSLLQQFELVLLLPLHMRAVAAAVSLQSLLTVLHSSSSVCDAVAQFIEGRDGEGVLIIADGWDELTESKRNESFFYNLLFQRYSSLSVVVTSRPSASAKFHSLQHIDRFVEVCGFSKDLIIEYVHADFAYDQSSALSVVEQLESNPLIESVCNIPLNCVIVCYLWRTLQGALPKTMTELYTKIILNVVLRNIWKFNTYSSVLSLANFDALPIELQQPWWCLCQFAYQALARDQLVFSTEELLSTGLSTDQVLCFGLLESAESLSIHGSEVSFHFLHLTFQEYLAALHLSRQPSHMHHEICQLYTRKSHLRMVCRMFFGFIFHVFERYSSWDAKQIVECIADEGMFSDPLPLCLCAFEAQNDQVDREVSQFLVNYQTPLGMIKLGNPKNPYDCHAVLYVLSNIHVHGSSGIVIDFSNCGLKQYQLKTLVDVLMSKRMLQVVKLDLRGNRLTVPALISLENAVDVELLTELTLLNLSGSLFDDANANAELLRRLIKALSSHCPKLEEVDFSCNNLGVPGAQVYGTIVSHCGSPPKFFSNILLNAVNLGDEGVKEFVACLKEIHILKKLSLANNNIHSSGVSYLADAICVEKLFMKGCCLNLSDNPLGCEGVDSIGRILCNSSNCIESVNLSCCELTTPLDDTDFLSLSARHLSQLPQSSSIKFLYLYGNVLTGQGIHILFGFMHLCPHLILLDTGNCCITSNDLTWLLDRLAQLGPSGSALESWALNDNAIDDVGVSALMDHLPTLFPNFILYALHVGNNLVTKEMLRRVNEEGWRRREVIERSKDQTYHQDRYYITLHRIAVYYA